jgi:hypothetical protein
MFPRKHQDICTNLLLFIVITRSIHPGNGTRDWQTMELEISYLPMYKKVLKVFSATYGNDLSSFVCLG